MEFRAQDHHRSDQMRATSATATTFNPSTTPHHHHHLGSDNRIRRSSSSTISNTQNHNGNSSPNPNSTPTPLLINPTPIITTTTNTPNNCTNTPQPQTLDPNPNPNPRPKTTSSSTTPTSVKYKECLKNYAASAGGSVLDGCGEFMPSGEEGSLEALKCAACQCHRNFHRKEIDGEPPLLYSPGTRRSTNSLMLNPLHLALPSPTPTPTSHGPHHHLHHHYKYPIVQPMNVAYGGISAVGGGDSSSEELNADNSAPPQAAYQHSSQYHSSQFGMSKKRFRTKFTQEQKDRMLEFAERVEWRLQKQDEEEVERFCAEVGVKRQVLKVWMHNNKSSNVNKLGSGSSSNSKQQLDHVSVMMGNLGNSGGAGAGSAGIHDGNVIVKDDQIEEGELDT